MKKSFFLFIFISASSLLLGQDYTASSEIDMEKGNITVTVDTFFSGENTFTMRKSAESMIEEKLPEILSKTLSETKSGKIIYDRSKTMEEKFMGSPDFITMMDSIISGTSLKSSVFRPDMSGLKIIYDINIFPSVVRYFISHTACQPVKKEIKWVPSCDYTGIVIFAEGLFPVHGEEVRSSAVPALFPEIYDTEMHKIISADTTDMKYLLKWGTAGYADSPDKIDDFKNRIGDKPLFTMAREIFGKNRTDIVVPETVYDQIFCSENNLHLVREGRCLIICDLK